MLIISYLRSAVWLSDNSCLSFQLGIQYLLLFLVNDHMPLLRRTRTLCLITSSHFAFLELPGSFLDQQSKLWRVSITPKNTVLMLYNKRGRQQEM
ncbi:hypothetical protein EYC80_007039 [Monilinia laxa]|uniref:Uncharacterized protein n=1 Tax=Monilinia laxa TaxID=61186 RepID=A0A5N6K002_MONLA|nr:hypothetical protein EYC80_007039 [Monilinia laxa]